MLAVDVAIQQTTLIKLKHAWWKGLYCAIKGGTSRCRLPCNPPAPDPAWPSVPAMACENSQTARVGLVSAMPTFSLEQQARSVPPQLSFVRPWSILMTGRGTPAGTCEWALCSHTPKCMYRLPLGRRLMFFFSACMHDCNQILEVGRGNRGAEQTNPLLIALVCRRSLPYLPACPCVSHLWPLCGVCLPLVWGL